MSLNQALAKAAEDLTRRMAESLNRILAATERPQQLEIFHLPPIGYWVYKVEYRVWIKWMDGREGWGEWINAEKRGVCRRWYSRRADAEKAMERRKRSVFWTDRGREFRVKEHWREFKPSRRH